MTPVFGKASPNALQEEFMLCKVCLENFDSFNRQPKQLPCTHIYCHRCVEKFLVKGKRNQSKKVICPLCNQSTKFGKPDDLRTCQHSIDLVNLFKPSSSKKSKSHFGDTHESDMDAFGVEQSKRTVVKTSNPLLHPSSMWSDINLGGAEDIDNLSSIERTSPNQLLSYDTNANKREMYFNNVPQSLKNLWNHDLSEDDSNVCSAVGMSDMQFDYRGIKYKNSFNENSFQDNKSNANYVSINQLPVSSQERLDAKYVSPHPDEGDDLDWNYFTQNLDTSKSTLTSAQFGMKSDDFDKQTFSLNIADELSGTTLHSYDSMLSGSLVSPTLIRSSPEGNFVAIIDKATTDESIVKIFTIEGIEKGEFKVPNVINDVCFLNNRSLKLSIAVATKDGITILDSETIIKGRNYIPIGPTKFVASYNDGFVAAQMKFLTLCMDLSCNTVLHSIKNIHGSPNTAQGENIFNELIDMNTCRGSIGLLFTDQCIIIDHQGNQLKLIKFDKAEPNPELQLSFAPLHAQMLIIDRKRQLSMLYSEPNFDHISISVINSEGTIISGTLTGDHKMVTIAHNRNSYSIDKYISS